LRDTAKDALSLKSISRRVPQSIPKGFWDSPDIFSSLVAHPKGSFRPAWPYMLSGVPSLSPLHRGCSGDAGRSEKRGGKWRANTSLTHRQFWGRAFGEPNWAATPPKRGTKKTRPPNARSGSLWGTLWGCDWGCSKGISNGVTRPFAYARTKNAQRLDEKMSTTSVLTQTWTKYAAGMHLCGCVRASVFA
jgi:hypothetical protein